MNDFSIRTGDETLAVEAPVTWGARSARGGDTVLVTHVFGRITRHARAAPRALDAGVLVLAGIATGSTIYGLHILDLETPPPITAEKPE